MNNNILELSNILDTDSYKFSQWVQYPPKTTAMSSYFESRGGVYDKTLFFGLQYYLKRFFTSKLTMDLVEEVKEFSELHGVPFNYEGFASIVTDLDGKLPLKIKAVPEGMVIPKLNMLIDVESTSEEHFWLVSWFETMFVRIWYSITVATNSYECKKIIMSHLEKSSDNPQDEIMFKLHDFGSRGATCQESAMIGGASHLVNFMGSDTIAGVWMANKYYNSKMSGFSIPASEHSTITMWGKENELKAYKNMIKQFGNNDVFACVSDSYNIYLATEKMWGEELKEEVLNMKATLVVRPDSGNPVEIVLDLLNILADKYGYTINSKGYKVLNKVRVIQGDGIDIDDIQAILTNIEENGYSATNVNFGMGGGLLQKDLNRDTHKFAFKCSWAIVDGKEVEVFKAPITDEGKQSKKGRLDLVGKYDENGVLKVKTVGLNDTLEDGYESLMKVVYENGEIIHEYTFEEVRSNSNILIENVEV